jgi:hypothetical protein
MMRIKGRETMKNQFLLLLVILAVCIFLLPAQIFSKTTKIRLYVEEGQVYGRNVRVYVPNVTITEDMDPFLYLERTGENGRKFYPIEVAPDQQWIEKGKDAKSGIQTGTLLLFDLKRDKENRREWKIRFYQPYKRVFPILHWNDSKRTKADEKPVAISDREVVIGNPLGASLWSAFVLILFILISYRLVKKIGLDFVDFIKISEGRVSLSLFQLAIWTTAIGYMVLCCGLMKMHVPYIPDTLLWLMGLSVATGGAGHWQAHRLQEEGLQAAQRKAKQNQAQSATSINQQSNENKNHQNSSNPEKSSSLGSMLTILVKGKESLSLAKIQLLLWTVVTIIIFFVKSYLLLELWEVPYQLVLLMGISQTGFIARNQMAIEEYKKEGKDSAGSQEDQKDIKQGNQPKGPDEVQSKPDEKKKD